MARPNSICVSTVTSMTILICCKKTITPDIHLSHGRSWIFGKFVKGHHVCRAWVLERMLETRRTWVLERMLETRRTWVLERMLETRRTEFATVYVHFMGSQTYHVLLEECVLQLRMQGRRDLLPLSVWRHEARPRNGLIFELGVHHNVRLCVRVPARHDKAWVSMCACTMSRGQ